MEQQPLISAIIIFLNEERFLEEAIASVFQQTYENWELLLVDDGSTDGSRAIAQQYVTNYPQKVRYLEHPGHQNLGMSASRKLGVHAAQGDYIAYLDGDDVWLPHKLEQQLALLHQYPQAAMVLGPLQQWYSWNGRPEDQGRDRLYGDQNPYRNTVVPAPKLLALFLEHDEFIPSGFLVQRAALDAGRIYEDQFREGYSDAVALVKFCLNHSVYVSEQCWYLYRKHPQSSTYRSWLNGKEDREPLVYWEWIATYFQEHQVADPELSKILRRKLWSCHHPTLSRWLSSKHWLDRIEILIIQIGRKILPLSIRHQLWLHWENLRFRIPKLH
jgi:glycosyltransferase involved in cell wall biosynthesis